MGGSFYYVSQELEQTMTQGALLRKYNKVIQRAARNRHPARDAPPTQKHTHCWANLMHSTFNK